MSTRWRIAALVAAIVLVTGAVAWVTMYAVDRDSKPFPARTVVHPTIR